MTAPLAAGMVCTTVSCIHACVHLCCLLVFSELVVVRCRWFLSGTDLPSTLRGTHTGHHGTGHHSDIRQGLRICTVHVCTVHVHIQNEAMSGHVCFWSVFTYSTCVMLQAVYVHTVCTRSFTQPSHRHLQFFCSQWSPLYSRGQTHRWPSQVPLFKQKASSWHMLKSGHTHTPGAETPITNV